jgi:hypothetical protein
MPADTSILQLGAFHPIGLPGNFIADETEKWVEGNQVRQRRTGVIRGVPERAVRRIPQRSMSVWFKLSKNQISLLHCGSAKTRGGNDETSP